jgi:hypothetical protein
LWGLSGVTIPLAMEKFEKLKEIKGIEDRNIY